MQVQCIRKTKQNKTHIHIDKEKKRTSKYINKQKHQKANVVHRQKINKTEKNQQVNTQINKQIKKKTLVILKLSNYRKQKRKTQK